MSQTGKNHRRIAARQSSIHGRGVFALKRDRQRNAHHRIQGHLDHR